MIASVGALFLAASLIRSTRAQRHLMRFAVSSRNATHASTEASTAACVRASESKCAAVAVVSHADDEDRHEIWLVVAGDGEGNAMKPASRMAVAEMARKYVLNALRKANTFGPKYETSDLTSASVSSK